MFEATTFERRQYSLAAVSDRPVSHRLVCSAYGVTAPILSLFDLANPCGALRPATCVQGSENDGGARRAGRQSAIDSMICRSSTGGSAAAGERPYRHTTGAAAERFIAGSGY